MKPRIHLIQSLLTASLALAAGMPLSLRAAPPAQTAKPEPPPAVSTFAIPASTPEGRDPFFPDSTRVYAGNPKNQKSQAPVLTGLALKSIMGAPPHIFAIINNHTFAVGDDGDVITQSGVRLHISCTDINLQAGTVTVEGGGMREVLHLSGGL
jgi:hypothetical protein